MVNGGPDFKIFSLIICIALILKYLFLSTVTAQFSSTCCLIHRVLVVQCWTLPPFLEIPGFLKLDRSNSYIKLSLLIWYFRRTEDTSPYCLSFLLTSSFFPTGWRNLSAINTSWIHGTTDIRVACPKWEKEKDRHPEDQLHRPIWSQTQPSNTSSSSFPPFKEETPWAKCAQDTPWAYPSLISCIVHTSHYQDHGKKNNVLCNAV